MKIEMLNEYIFSQMVMEKAGEIAYELGGEDALVSEEVVRAALDSLMQDRVAVMQMLRGHPDFDTNTLLP